MYLVRLRISKLPAGGSFRSEQTHEITTRGRNVRFEKGSFDGRRSIGPGTTDAVVALIQESISVNAASKQTIRRQTIRLRKLCTWMKSVAAIKGGQVNKEA
jgi:hypothetical protein